MGDLLFIDNDEEILVEVVERNFSRIQGLLDRLLVENDDDEVVIEIPAAFGSTKGKQLLETCAREFGMNAKTAMEHTILVLSSLSGDLTKLDNDKLLDSPTLLLRDILEQYHRQRIARISCLTELLRMEQERDEAAKALDSLEKKKNDDDKRGIFRFLLEIIAEEPVREPGTSREILHLTRKYQESRRTEALEAFLVLVYNRIDVTFDDYLSICEAFEDRNFFAHSEPRATSLAAFILISCCSLWRVTGEKWTNEHPLLAGGMCTDDKRLDLVQNVMEQLFQNMVQRASTLQGRSTANPEALAMLSMGLLLKLASRSILDLNMGIEDPALSRLDSLGTKVVEHANQRGALDYLEVVLQELVTKVNLSSQDENSELGPDSLIAASLGRELVSAMVLAFGDSILSTELEASTDNIGTISRLMALSFANSPILCGQFWDEWKSYKAQSEDNILPLCSVLDSAYLLAQSSLPTAYVAYSPEVIVQDCRPLLCLLGSLVQNVSPNQFLLELLPDSLLKTIFTVLVSPVINSKAILSDARKDIMSSLVLVARVPDGAKALRAVTKPETFTAIAGMLSDECSLAALISLLAALCSDSPKEWSLSAFRSLGYILSLLSRRKEFLSATSGVVGPFVQLAQRLLVNVDEDLLLHLEARHATQILDVYQNCLLTLLSSLPLLLEMHSRQNSDTIRNCLSTAKQIFDLTTVAFLSLSYVAESQSANDHLSQATQNVLDNILSFLERSRSAGGSIFLFAVQPVALTIAVNLASKRHDVSFLSETNSDGGSANHLSKCYFKLCRDVMYGDTEELKDAGRAAESRGWLPYNGFQDIVVVSEAALCLISVWTSQWKLRVERISMSGDDTMAALGPFVYLSSRVDLFPTVSDRDIVNAWSQVQCSYMNHLQIYLSLGDSMDLLPSLSAECLASLIVSWTSFSVEGASGCDPLQLIDSRGLIAILTKESPPAERDESLSLELLRLLNVSLQGSISFVDWTDDSLEKFVTHRILKYSETMKHGSLKTEDESSSTSFALECIRTINCVVDSNSISPVTKSSFFERMENKDFWRNIAEVAFRRDQNSPIQSNLSSEAMKLLLLKISAESSEGRSSNTTIDHISNSAKDVSRVLEESANSTGKAFQELYSTSVSGTEKVIESLLFGLISERGVSYDLNNASSFALLSRLGHTLESVRRICSLVSGYSGTPIFDKAFGALETCEAELRWIRTWKFLVDLLLSERESLGLDESLYLQIFEVSLKSLRQIIHSLVPHTGDHPSLEVVAATKLFEYSTHLIHALLHTVQFVSESINETVILESTKKIHECCEALQQLASMMPHQTSMLSSRLLLLSTKLLPFGEDGMVELVDPLFSLLQHSPWILLLSSTSRAGVELDRNLLCILTFLSSNITVSVSEDWMRKVCVFISDSGLLQSLVRLVGYPLSESSVPSSTQVLGEKKELFVGLFDLFTACSTLGSSQLLDCALESNVLALCARIFQALNTESIKSLESYELGRKQSAKAKKVHVVVISILRYLGVSLRSCRLLTSDTDLVQQYTRSTLILLQAQKGLLLQSIESCANIGTRAGSEQPKSVALSTLTEARYVTFLFGELCESDTMIAVKRTAGAFFEEFTEKIRLMITHLSRYLGSTGASRELFRVLEASDFGREDLLTDISPLLPLLTGGNTRHEAIRYSHLVSNAFEALGEDEKELESQYPGRWFRRASEDAQDPNTVTRLERHSRLSVTNKFQFRVEAEILACLSNGLSVLWVVHPAARSFLPIEIGSDETAANIFGSIREGVIISFLTTDSESPRKKRTSTEFGKVLAIDTYARVVKVDILGDVPTETKIIKASNIVGIEDLSMRRRSLLFAAAPDTTSEVETFTGPLSSGHLIFLLRWCQQYFRELLDQKEDHVNDVVDSVRVLAHQAVAFLSNEMTLYSEIENVDSMKGEKKKIALQLLDLFGEPDDFGPLNTDSPKFGRLRDVLSQDDWSLARRQLEPFLQAATASFQKRLDSSQRELGSSSGLMIRDAGLSSPFRGIR